jgi:hypothetical protein
MSPRNVLDAGGLAVLTVSSSWRVPEPDAEAAQPEVSPESQRTPVMAGAPSLAPVAARSSPGRTHIEDETIAGELETSDEDGHDGDDSA